MTVMVRTFGHGILGLVLGALGVVLLGPAPMARAADPASCTVSPILVNSCRPWFGGTASDYPQVARDKKSQILYHEQRIGRQLEIAHTYHGYGDNALDERRRVLRDASRHVPADQLAAGEHLVHR